MDTTRKTAMISSTALDLPEHRQLVRDACLAAEVFPKIMESLPARDEDAIAASMSLVDAADIYIGIYGHRYGHVPKGSKTSITEMEFDRASERRIAILAFLMDPRHRVTADMVEGNAVARRKLEKLKARVCAGRIRKLFSTAQELRGQVESALRDILLRELSQRLHDAEERLAQARAAELAMQAELQRTDQVLRDALGKLQALQAAAVVAEPGPGGVGRAG